jgi:hypothetical protein
MENKMAYMSQERKKNLTPAIKKALKDFGLKGTIAVRNHSTLVVNISSGKIDFIGNYNETTKHNLECGRPRMEAKDSLDINPYWYHEHFTGDALNALKAILTAMNVGNHNRSDSMSDYFDVGWYVNVNIGQWDKAYMLEV